MSNLFLLYESASGYGLFRRAEAEAIGAKLREVQASVVDLSRFSRMVKLVAFLPFLSAENALENINAVSEGEATPYLAEFLAQNLPIGAAGIGADADKKKKKKKKKSKSSSSSSAAAAAGSFQLGVVDPKIGNMLGETLGVPCVCDDLTRELLRGCRLHFEHYISALRPGDLEQAQLGLSHSYSRAKVKFNVNKADNMIIQSIALLDQLDKDLNTFAMRVREWYSWHFPELVQIVNDNAMFCRLARFIKHKGELSEDKLPELEKIVDGDATKAAEILSAARMSMGTDISEIDMINIEHFATRVIELADFRTQLHKYLNDRMNNCAPNLSSLIGEQVGARLISHAGSLTNLAKYPASTLQILGAEKALFRALKTRGNTPKYGLIFHSSFIGRASAKNKGRISRYLANKCSIASRIDAFTDDPSNAFGEKLRDQVEERLQFYKTGKPPRKNADVMKEVIDDLGGDVTAVKGSSSSSAAAPAADASPKKKGTKRKLDDAEAETATATNGEAEGAAPKKHKKDKKKKDKKKKKKKKSSSSD